MRRLVVILVLAMVVVQCAVALAQTSDVEQFGAKQRETQMEGSKNILYKIDEEFVITQSDFDLQKQSIQFSNEYNLALANADKDMLPDVRARIEETAVMPGDQEILDELIGNLVLLAEAKKLGIGVSSEVAASYIAEEAKAIQQSLENGTPDEQADARKAVEVYQAFIKGMDMDDATYKSEIQIPSVVRLLTRNAVREHFIAENAQLANGPSDEIEAAFQEYVLTLRENYPPVG